MQEERTRMWIPLLPHFTPLVRLVSKLMVNNSCRFLPSCRRPDLYGPVEDVGIAAGQTRRLSDLLRRPVTDSGGESLGRLTDIIVRLRGADYPLVIGIVVTIAGKREVFVPIDKVGRVDGEVLKLTTAKLDLRHFERREGEVLLRAGGLGHRLNDGANARLVRAADLRLQQDNSEWMLTGVDARNRPRRLFGLLGPRKE